MKVYNAISTYFGSFFGVSIPCMDELNRIFYINLKIYHYRRTDLPIFSKISNLKYISLVPIIEYIEYLNVLLRPVKGHPIKLLNNLDFLSLEIDFSTSPINIVNDNNSNLIFQVKSVNEAKNSNKLLNSIITLIEIYLLRTLESDYNYTSIDQLLNILLLNKLKITII